MTARSDQKKIIDYLKRRLVSGDHRYCTIPTISKATGIIGSNQYILTLTDDLETMGLLTTRQMYQMKGGRLFQITAAGIDAADTGDIPTGVDSAAWTGRYNLSDGQRVELKRLLNEMRTLVTTAKLSNSKTANAMALIDAVEKLTDTPDPLWPEIMRLLRSPTLAGIVGVAGLVLSIVQILMAAAGK